MKRLLQYIISAICILTPLLCDAAFQGFPLAEGTNTSWYAIHAQYAPISQIYSGIVERCTAVAIAPPSWTQTLYIDNSATGTVASITVTNAIGPVAYTNAWTNGLAYPVVSHAMLAELDDTIDALIPYFASTNIYLYPDSTGGRYTRQTFFSEAGIGLVSTNVQVVGTNSVTNVVARWTRSPERRWTENLIEMHNAGTNGWQLIAAQPVEWWNPSASTATAASVSVVTGAPLPVVSYGPTSATWSVSLAGVDLYGSNRTETVTAGNACTVSWHSITGTPVITGFDGSATGAWFAVQYTNNLTVYGDRPYRLYAADLDERAKALAALVNTSVIQSTFTNGYRYSASGRGLDSSDPTYAAARAEAEADWAETSTLTGPGLHWNQTFESAGRRAWLASTCYRPYLRNVSTNIARSVKFLAYLVPLNEPYGWDYQRLLYSDFDTGHTTGRWNNVWFGPVNKAADIDSGFWFPVEPGTQPLPWNTEIPATNNTAVATTIGDIPAYGIKALINWDFQYK
jgi:hypothetical protein